MDKKRVEEEYCEGCKTKDLREIISGLVNKLVGKNKEIEIKEEQPRKVESKEKVFTENQSKSIREKLSSKEEWTETTSGIKFLHIPAGKFIMGSPPTEKGRYADRENQVERDVNSFLLAETEVTQVQWEVIVGNNPSRFKGQNLPVESVSWDDTQDFIKKLNTITGKKFRIPDEVE